MKKKQENQCNKYYLRLEKIILCCGIPAFIFILLIIFSLSQIYNFISSNIVLLLVGLVIVLIVFFFLPFLTKIIADRYVWPKKERHVCENQTEGSPYDLLEARHIVTEDIRHIDTLVETHTWIIIGSAVLVWGGVLMAQNYWIVGIILFIGLVLLIEMMLSVLRLAKIYIRANVKLIQIEKCRGAVPTERPIFCDTDGKRRLMWTGYHHILVLTVGLVGINIFALILWFTGRFPFAAPKDTVCVLNEIHDWIARMVMGLNRY